MSCCSISGQEGAQGKGSCTDRRNLLLRIPLLSSLYLLYHPWNLLPDPTGRAVIPGCIYHSLARACAHVHTHTHTHIHAFPSSGRLEFLESAWLLSCCPGGGVPLISLLLRCTHLSSAPSGPSTALPIPYPSPYPTSRSIALLLLRLPHSRSPRGHLRVGNRSV